MIFTLNIAFIQANNVPITVLLSNVDNLEQGSPTTGLQPIWNQAA